MRSLERTVGEAVPGAVLHTASTFIQAIALAEEATMDIAFLDINMRDNNGLELAKRLKEMCDKTNIVFVTGYSQYAIEAFKLRASGYLMKPVNAEDIRREMNNLRYPVRQREPGVRIQTFGNFEIYVDEKPIHFKRSKAKEVLAYLVDRRGASVSKKELSNILFEDGAYTRTRQSHLQTLVAEMMRALSEAGADDIIIKRRNQLSIDVNRVNCDYFNFINWDARAVNAYGGEYMTNYSWAEFTTGELNRRK